MFQVHGFLSHWKYLRLEIGTLDSLLEQWNFSAHINITILFISVKKFFTAKCGNFYFEFCTLFFFLYDLITNKARKLEVAESNLIMQNIPTLSPFLLFGFSFFLVHVLSLAHYLSLSLALSLTLLLMTRFSCCYVASCHHLIPSPHAPTIKLNLVSLNYG